MPEDIRRMMQFRLPEQTRKDLAKLATKLDCSMTDVVIRAVAKLAEPTFTIAGEGEQLKHTVALMRQKTRDMRADRQPILKPNGKL